MSESYRETLEGEMRLRCAPGKSHEVVCRRLHDLLGECLQRVSTSRLLPMREPVQLSGGTVVRPDVTLVTVATGKPWLIGEVIDSEDHHTDTVIKKTIYEENGLARLWMIDPRFNNVEVYHGTPYGLSLKAILAVRDQLTETLLPEFCTAIPDLFAAASDCD
jgi:Uma2 family endonuclease